MSLNNTLKVSNSLGCCKVSEILKVSKVLVAEKKLYIKEVQLPTMGLKNGWNEFQGVCTGL